MASIKPSEGEDERPPVFGLGIRAQIEQARATNTFIYRPLSRDDVHAMTEQAMERGDWISARNWKFILEALFD